MYPAFFSPLLIYGSLGFLVVWLVVPLIQRLVRQRAREARIGSDGEQATPVSRFGGVALAAAFLLVTAAAGFFIGKGAIGHKEWVIIIGALAMFGVGFFDDIHPVGAKVKLVAQLLVAAAVYFGGVRIENFTNPFTHTTVAFGVWGFPATVFWLVALTNLVNLIDGIDGLAGGIALMMMCLLGYTEAPMLNFHFLVTAGMAGALLAFIYYNFPPAKIYMGDGGAYFLGFLIGLETVENSQKGTVAAALVAPVFALALPILDVTLAILRRGLKGLPIFRPDRRHIHHRMLDSGLSRRRTLLTLYGVSLFCLVMAFGVFWAQGRLLPILVGVMFLLLLVAVRSLGLMPEWLMTGGVWGDVMQMRRETRYALSLARWLELEAERCETLPELWEGFAFLSAKLGFVRVRFELEKGEAVWSRDGMSVLVECQTLRQEIALGNIRAIEFSAPTGEMSPKLFEHLAELGAEAWVKAAIRWERVRGGPIQVDSGVMTGVLNFWGRDRHYPQTV